MKEVCRVCGKAEEEGLHHDIWSMDGYHGFQTYEMWAEEHLQEFNRQVAERAYQMKVDAEAQRIVGLR